MCSCHLLPVVSFIMYAFADVPSVVACLNSRSSGVVANHCCAARSSSAVDSSGALLPDAALNHVGNSLRRRFICPEMTFVVAMCCRRDQHTTELRIMMIWALHGGGHADYVHLVARAVMCLRSTGESRYARIIVELRIHKHEDDCPRMEEQFAAVVMKTPLDH